jgi:hypothetical protein
VGGARGGARLHDELSIRGRLLAAETLER